MNAQLLQERINSFDTQLNQIHQGVQNLQAGITQQNANFNHLNGQKQECLYWLDKIQNTASITPLPDHIHDDEVITTEPIVHCEAV